MKMNFRSKLQGAFSLVEVVVALGIFAFSILTIIGLMGSSLNLTQDNQQRIQAANMATIITGRYKELLAAQARGETPQWGNIPMPQNPTGSSNTFSTLEFIDDVGNRVANPGDAAFGLEHMITVDDISASAGSKLIRCTLRLQWPPLAAGKENAVSMFTTTTGFVITP